MFKSAFVVAIGLAALLTTPAFAAKHQRSCYDFAWESQDQKDCLANPDKMRHMSMHKTRHKPMHHGMTDKDMKGMHDKDMPTQR